MQPAHVSLWLRHADLFTEVPGMGLSRKFISTAVHRTNPAASSGPRSPDPALVASSQCIGVMNKDAE